MDERFVCLDCDKLLWRYELNKHLCLDCGSTVWDLRKFFELGPEGMAIISGIPRMESFWRKWMQKSEVITLLEEFKKRPKYQI